MTLEQYILSYDLKNCGKTYGTWFKNHAIKHYWFGYTVDINKIMLSAFTSKELV